MQKVIIIGVGNILFKDEGVGVYATKYLAKNYSFSPEIEILDGGTLGFKLMGYFQEYENVILLDTVSIEDTAGSVYRLPADELLGLGSYRKTAHEVEVVEMLEICSMLEKMAAVTVIGIVPQDIETVVMQLTDEVLGGFETLIQTVIRELDSLGVQSTKTSNISIESIIENFLQEEAR